MFYSALQHLTTFHTVFRTIFRAIFRTMFFMLTCSGVLFIAACGGNSDDSYNKKTAEQLAALAELQKNQKKWENSARSSYEYSILISCFCIYTEKGELRVTVVDGEITEAYSTRSAEYLSENELEHIMTIDEAFGYIAVEILEAHSSFDVAYDEELGYPTAIRVDVESQAQDAGITYLFSDVM